MIELLVAMAVASQGAESSSQNAVQPTQSTPVAQTVLALSPNYLLDPSLPYVFVPSSKEAGAAAKIAVAPDRSQAPKPALAAAKAQPSTGPEDDLGLLASLDSGKQAAPEWAARPPGQAPRDTFGAGSDLRRVATQVSRADTKYKVGKRLVKLEIFRPDTEGQRPGILLLHGASGMGNGAFYRGAAESFAEAGYIVYLPHYLGERNRNRPRGRALIAEFEQQYDTVHAALDEMAKDSRVDNSRMAAFGFSLGGFQALGLSSRDKRISAVVNMGGGMPGNVEPTTTRVAPTLILHGQKDRTVPVARASRTRDLFKKLDVPYEMVVFPNQPHFFQASASREAIDRSIGFFDRQLKPVEPVATADLLNGR
ncbi:MAG: prolyl oligopeptidase family serine peptidase [Alphaproteobacteria bacterium]|nr:prolyl oligopeptidase family serine peptidase [Alphaproteobacteria bacterium]